MSAVSVTAKLSGDSSAVRLAVAEDVGFTSPVYSALASSSGGRVRLWVGDLDPDTDYFCAIEADGTLDTATVGKFRTPPAPGPASFTCAFSGDSTTDSNAAVFAQIVTAAPLFFIHLGDLHYQDIATNSLAAYLAAYDDVFAQANPAKLVREVSTLYTWDDHDYGPNNSDGNHVGRPAACEAYRTCVPHPELAESGATGAIYYSFEVGRVVFIVTDQRSLSDDKDDTDNASKSILGATQKAWMKAILSDPANEHKMFVWVCSRTFGAVPTVGSDTWGGFTTERTELADYIKANCPGRVVVLSADMHSLAIDDGTNHDFATGGGEPLQTFQAAPLDRTGAETTGGATYSEGGRFLNNGQYGTMEVTDAGGADISVVWRGFNSSGTELVEYAFTVPVGAP